jgi:hypothetical protein
LISFYLLLILAVIISGCEANFPTWAICEVQGQGLVSPFLDQEVTINGLIVADLGGTERGEYLILDEHCPLSEYASRGLHISLITGHDQIALGDLIRLMGVVREIEGETHLDVAPQGVEHLQLDNPLPEPVDLGLALSAPLDFGYEMWEGQLVAIPQATVLKTRTSTSRLLVLPQIKIDPSIPIVCFEEEPFLLEVDSGLLRSGLESIPPASVLENLVGFIREDQNGYYLQLIEKPILVDVQGNNQRRKEKPATSVRDLVGTSPNIPQPPKTPSATPAPDTFPILTSSPTIKPSPTYYPVRILITEILPNPLGEEPEGEWIEIYNLGGGSLPLEGIKIGDEFSPSGKEGLLGFPGGFFIHEGQILVIANQAREFEYKYGFLPDFEMVNSDPRVPNMIPYHPWGGSAVKLSNTGDEVLVVDPWDRVVDLVVYGNSSTVGFSRPVGAPDEGHSLERYPPDRDYDQGEDWRERNSPSPGRLDHTLPTVPATNTSSLIPTVTTNYTPTASAQFATSQATTICPSPSAVKTSTLTWSVTSTPEPIASEPPSSLTSTFPPETLFVTSSHTITSSPLPSLSQTLTLIVATTSLPALTGEVTLSVTAEKTGSPTPEVTATGTSSPGLITSTPSVVQTHTPSPTGTPIPWLTPTLTPGPELIINEILADPDPILGDSNQDGVISSGEDEFLELVNISDQPLDLAGWSVWDAVLQRFTFPQGTSLSSGCGLVIFGGGDPSGDFGGSLVFVAGSLGLNNQGDEITVFDDKGVEVAAISYGPEGNQDQSLTRFPDLYGPLPFVLHSLIPGVEEALFSPGTKTDLTAFGSCP